MRKPGDQASFFRLLAEIVYYLVSGNSKVGNMNMEEWNPLYQRIYGLQVTTHPCLPDCRNVQCTNAL